MNNKNFEELRYSLRIDEELMEKLRDMALEHERSINSEIIYIIKQEVKKFEEESKKGD